MTTLEIGNQQRAIDRIGWPIWLLAAAAIIVLMVLILYAMGRSPFYTGGSIKLWYPLRSGPEQSQHFADWYTFTHILHGPAFFLLLWLVFKKGLKWTLPAGLLFMLAVAIEAGWEIIENTDFIINRYREKTIARGYSGDTILNSVGDTLAMAVGYLFTMRYRIWTVVAGFLLLDLALLIGLRDNLSLNVIMLLFGGWDIELIQSIKRWQQSAALGGTVPLVHVALVGFARVGPARARPAAMMRRWTRRRWSRPLHDHLLGLLKASRKPFCDETRCPVLDPGRGKTKTGYLWAIARDDRPWGGTDPPAVVYSYAPGRGGRHAVKLLDGFAGVLQVDGYAGYNALGRSVRPGRPVTLAYCWSHLRRKFYEVYVGGHSPIATQALARINELYAAEDEIRGLPPELRRRARQDRSKPIVEALKFWFQQSLAAVPKGGKIGEALAYGLNHWDGLTRFLDDGRIEIDSNTVERSIRGLAPQSCSDAPEIAASKNSATTVQPWRAA
jgi:hypothetical protein